MKMFRLSNNIVGCLNLLMLLLSIPILASGIWLATRSSTDCEKLMQGRAIALGAFLMVVSLAGFIGACFRVSWLLWFYLVVMLLVILLHVGFIIFDFVVTTKGSDGEAMSGRGYKEYHLGDYSHWLQQTVDDSENWAKIRSCLIENKVCKSLQESNETYNQFFKSNLSPIQSGCCKPPSECGFVYQNATVWNKPTAGFTSNNPDCNTWQNNQSLLCYDCQSCKAGVLANPKSNWRKAVIVNTVFVVILVIIYAIGCHALRNDREDNALPRLKGFP